MENGMERVDIAIIGTGPAGVSAAITAKVRNKSVLLIGSRELSEKMSKAHQILNYPGLPEVSGADLVAGDKKQLAGLGIEVTEKRVNAVYAMGDYFGIQVSGEILEASTVILAAGIVMGKPFPGENELLGSGVSYCATCDAQFFRGKEVAVIGYGREAEQEADYLAEIVGKVHYFPMGKEEPQLSDAIEVVHERPKAITGTQTVSALETDAGSHPVDGVFILRDAIAPSQLVPGLATEENHVKVNLQMETNLPGLFACGDITGKPYQYIKAAGQGNVAALSAAEYLDKKKREIYGGLSWLRRFRTTIWTKRYRQRQQWWTFRQYGADRARCLPRYWRNWRMIWTVRWHFTMQIPMRIRSLRSQTASQTFRRFYS